MFILANRCNRFIFGGLVGICALAVTTPALAQLAKPTITQIRHSPSGIVVAWTKPAGSNSFTIYWKGDRYVNTSARNPIAVNALTAGCANDNSCVHTIRYAHIVGNTAFKATGGYYFAITASNNNGATSALSKIVGGGGPNGNGLHPPLVFNHLRVSTPDFTFPHSDNPCSVVFPTVDGDGNPNYNNRTMEVTLDAADLRDDGYCRLPRATGGTFYDKKYQLLDNVGTSTTAGEVELANLGLQVANFAGGNPRTGSTIVIKRLASRTSDQGLIPGTYTFQYTAQDTTLTHVAVGRLTLRVVGDPGINLTCSGGIGSSCRNNNDTPPRGIGPFNVGTILTAPADSITPPCDDNVDCNSIPVEITSYAWQSCDAATGGACTPARGTRMNDGRAYRIDLTDLGRYVRASMSAAAGTSFATNRVEVDRAGYATIAFSGNRQRQNDRLTATINDTPTTGQATQLSNQTYQWHRGSGIFTPTLDCQVANNTCIPGATQRTYQLTPADLGLRIRVVATYTGAGGGTLISWPTPPIVDVNDPGLATIGDVVFNVPALATLIDPDPGVVIERYQWQLCTHARTTAAERVKAPQLEVIPNPGSSKGTLVVNTNYCKKITPISATHIAICAREMTRQEIRDGKTVTVTFRGSTNTPNGADTAAFIARKNENQCPGQVSAGEHIRVRITYDDAFGKGHEVYSDTKPVADISDGTQPVAVQLANIVSDKGSRSENYVGDVLTAGSFIVPSDSGVTFSDYTYQWQGSETGIDPWTEIDGETNSTYTLGLAALNRYVRVQVTATGSGSVGPIILVSNNSVRVSDRAGRAGLERAVTGFASSPVVVDADGDVMEINVGQWQVCTTESASSCQNVPPTNADNPNTYTPTTQQAQDRLYLRATGVRYSGAGGGSGLLTPAVRIVGVSLSPITRAQVAGADNYVDDVLTAGRFSLPGVTFSAENYRYQWQRSDAGIAPWSNIAGATAATYTIGSDDAGKSLRVVVSATGSNQQLYPDVPSGALAVINRVGNANLNGEAVVGMPSWVVVSDSDGAVRVTAVTWQICANPGPSNAGRSCTTVGADGDTNPLTFTPLDSQVDQYLKAINVQYTGAGGSPRGGLITPAVRIAPALNTEMLVDTVLPEVATAISTTIAAQTAARVNGVAAGTYATPRFELDGQRNLAAIVKSQAQAEMDGSRDMKRLIGNSSFALPFAADEPGIGLGGFWGQGSYQTLSGDFKGVEWDGSLVGFSLGIDLRLSGGSLLGLAINRQSGDFDLTTNRTPRKYEIAMSTVSPYLGGQFRGLDYHASFHIGSGEGKIITQNESNPAEHDLRSSGFSFGINGVVRQTENGAQRLKGDFVHSGIVIEDRVGESSTNSSRLRALFEHQHTHDTAAGSLVSSGEIGLRFDLGPATQGAELGGGMEYTRGRFKLGGKLRGLVAHSDQVSEFGLQIRVRIAPEQDQQGLSLALTPTYGQAASGLANLWENGVAQSGISTAKRAEYAWQMNARLGFGLTLPTAGLFTPYATAQHGDAPRYGLGLNYKPRVSDLELDLFGEQTATQQRILLKGSVGF